MYKKEVTITAEEGLHARPAALFTKKAAEFKETKMYVCKDDYKANAKSIMSVLALGAASGTKITLEAEGADEERAVEELCAIL